MVAVCCGYVDFIGPVRWAPPESHPMTAMTTAPHLVYVAHHALLLAIPAFLPAVIVVGVVLYVAMRDRRG